LGVAGLGVAGLGGAGLGVAGLGGAGLGVAGLDVAGLGVAGKALGCEGLLGILLFAGLVFMVGCLFEPTLLLIEGFSGCFLVSAELIDALENVGRELFCLVFTNSSEPAFLVSGCE
jgi:hypothetical protein